MTDRTVPTSTDTGERIEKLPAELEPGDWLAPSWIEAGESAAAEVLSAHPYTDAVESDKVLIVYREVGEDSPAVLRWWANVPVKLASAKEVDRARDDARRFAVVDQLCKLAQLISEHRLPLPGPYETVHVSFRFNGRRVDLIEEIGKKLGIEQVTAYGSVSVTWPPDRDGRQGELLTADWSTYTPKPEVDDDPTGSGFSRADVEDDGPPTDVPDGVEGHAETGRTNGGE